MGRGLLVTAVLFAMLGGCMVGFTIWKNHRYVHYHSPQYIGEITNKAKPFTEGSWLFVNREIVGWGVQRVTLVQPRTNRVARLNILPTYTNYASFHKLDYGTLITFKLDLSHIHEDMVPMFESFLKPIVQK